MCLTSWATFGAILLRGDFCHFKQPAQRQLGGFFIGCLMTALRETSAKRGYGSRWQRYRDRFLADHPLCVMHLALGQSVVATVVDHITPHKGDHKKFWDPKNHQALCKRCHDMHKQRLERSGQVVGCDVSGVPVDPNHHWRQG